jgi:hypothetical protein
MLLIGCTLHLHLRARFGAGSIGDEWAKVHGRTHPFYLVFYFFYIDIVDTHIYNICLF